MLALGLLLVLAGIGVTIAGTLRPASVARPAGSDVRALLYLAPMAAGLAAIYLLLVPSYQSVPGGRRTILEVNGPSALLPLLVPVLLASVPAVLWPRRASIVLAAGLGTLLAIFCVLAGFSIGMFYLPSAALLVAAGFLVLRDRERTA